MNFRIHPAVGIARVGNTEEYVIAPETMAGRPMPDGSNLTGGLPIRAGTERDVVRSSDLRDATGALKRHAARFRIFSYEGEGEESWPRGDGTEVTIGTPFGDKKVKDIVWTVHVANKKANQFVLVEDPPEEPQGIRSYEDGRLPPIRNAATDTIGAPQPPNDKKIDVLNDPARVRMLTIDPGPRTISSTSSASVHFDRETVASYYDTEQAVVVDLPGYPKSFPADSFRSFTAPAGPIDTLGSLSTDERGRLLVLGGYGRAIGWNIAGRALITDDVNNDQWFDDTSDGPVSATIEFDDGSTADAHGAWVTTTDPAYAPQILNAVSVWDDVYDCWVRKLGLAPDVYDEAKGGYQPSYKPTFDDQLAPVFRAAALQQWVTNLSQTGIAGHRRLAAISADNDPASTELAGLSMFRNPFDKAEQNNTSLMPLSLGDANESFLTLRQTQYFFLQRWNEGRDHFRPGGPILGPGEYLDKAAFVNCLGGRFSPGIDLTFIMREPELYRLPWRTSGAGPFRVNAKKLAYADVSSDKPLLTGGYVPRHVVDGGIEPGDISKFMAVPWHTDYNSCATHPPSPNPPGNRKVFWSWPAQRPVAVYLADDVAWRQDPMSGNTVATLGNQRWSVRGEGTDSTRAENWSRYQSRADILDNWHRIGVVMQAPAIDKPGDPLPADWYLEVEGRLTDTGLTPVVPFPNSMTGSVRGDASTLYTRELFFKLLNAGDYPEVLTDARDYVEYWLKFAEDLSNDPKSPVDQSFFPYSEQEFENRLQLIYQEFVDDAAAADPGNDPLIRNRDDVVTRIIQLAPFNLTDGAWLRNVGRTGPMDQARAMLYSIYMDELGDGDISKNHCNIYRDLCHDAGYYPPPIESREFAFDPRFLDSAFDVPAFELAISHFSDEYYPEIIGMTLQLEWEVVELKGTRDLLSYYGFDPHFYVMHIGIDNAENGHGRRAADAIRLYLENVYRAGGAPAVQRAWRRIWNGFVAFGNVGNWGADFKTLLTEKPTLEAQMLAMIRRKAEFGSRNHQQHMVGKARIDEWFADPPGFLRALEQAGWITPGDWDNSRMKALTDFETGPMFRVFTDDEIELWKRYTQSLAHPAPPPEPEPTIPPARAMAAVIDQLRRVQQGTAGHQTNMLADLDGKVHRLAWWFEQPTPSFMAALASPVNDVITPGRPNQSRFVTELIAPTGPMGSIFNTPAQPPNTGTCRNVVYAWIANGCPITAPLEVFSLRLSTPPAKRDLHPTGVIRGQGTIH